MVLGKEETAKSSAAAERLHRRAAERANPGFTGLAATFTGNFLLGPPGKLYGPFREPKQKPMTNATGMEPEHSRTITTRRCARAATPSTCRSCIAASRSRALRAGDLSGMGVQRLSHRRPPDGPLPLRAGAQAQTCQDCHMPSRDAFGIPYRSKIATIQEYSNFPQAEHTLPPQDIDLPVREGYGRHTLVGLNVFLIKMAQQFPDMLGIRKKIRC